MPSPPHCHDKQEAGGSGNDNQTNVQGGQQPSTKAPPSSSNANEPHEEKAISSSMMMIAPVMARLTGLSRESDLTDDGQTLFSDNHCATSSTVATTISMPAAPHPRDAPPPRHQERTTSNIRIPPTIMGVQASHVAEPETEQKDRGIASNSRRTVGAHARRASSSASADQQSNVFPPPSAMCDDDFQTISRDQSVGGDHIIADNSIPSLASKACDPEEDRHQHQVANLQLASSAPPSISAGTPEADTICSTFASSPPTTLQPIGKASSTKASLTACLVSASPETPIASVASKSQQDKDLPQLESKSSRTAPSELKSEVSDSKKREDLCTQDEPYDDTESKMSVSKDEDGQVSSYPDNAGSSQNGNVNDSKSKPKRKRNSPAKAGQSNGRWTHEEHQAFLDGLQGCGREWKKVAIRIPTRTSAQIRSHAQKYFAKLQRDEVETNLNSSGSSGGPPPDAAIMGGDGPQGGTTYLVGDASLLSTTIVTSQGLAPSVRRNVERIIADPHSAQREVENTLEALRERYRLLQQRLEDRRQRRHSSSNRRDSNGRPVEHYDTDDTRSEHSSPAPWPRTTHHHPASKSMCRENRSHVRHNRHLGGVDENSSVCSNVSSVAASRDLGNEEIIALEVLGGSLPRGDSSVDEENDSTNNAGSRAALNAPEDRQSMAAQLARDSPSHRSPHHHPDIQERQQQLHHQESKVSSDASLDASMEDATGGPHQEESSPNKRKRGRPDY